MRYFRHLIFSIIALLLVIVALANRESVVLTLVPNGLAGVLGFNFQAKVPLFIVIFLGVGVGLLIGFVWEWLREIKYRNAAKFEHRQVARLGRELTKLKTGNAKEQDDILFLLDELS